MEWVKNIQSVKIQNLHSGLFLCVGCVVLAMEQTTNRAELYWLVLSKPFTHVLKIIQAQVLYSVS